MTRPAKDGRTAETMLEKNQVIARLESQLYTAVQLKNAFAERETKLMRENDTLRADNARLRDQRDVILANIKRLEERLENAQETVKIALDVKTKCDVDTSQYASDRMAAERNVETLKEALRDVLGWYAHSDVAHLISSKHGEQADYHRKLNAARAALAGDGGKR